MKRMATYKNGNTYTTLYEDGTKEHFTMDDDFRFDFSESCDIQISQCCDNGCEFCYYGCSPTGKHGKLTGWKFFETMHPYTEIAINLQCPIPDDILSFLWKMHRQNVIVNATVNQNHFMRSDVREFLVEAIADDLIKGVGISLTNPRQDDFINIVKQYPNTVIHVIAGITPLKDIRYLMGHGLKLLILGYKKLERGEKYYNHYSALVEDNIKQFETELDEIIDGFKVVSFDNLAIKQLHLKDKLSEKEWETFYGGDDGTVTFFIDLVKGVFAKSSLSPITYPIGDKTIDEMFEIIRKEVEKDGNEKLS